MTRYKRCTRCGLVKKRTAFYECSPAQARFWGVLYKSECKRCCSNRRRSVSAVRSRYEVLDYFSQPLED